MPVVKVKGGYRWGSKGKVYTTKAEATKQGQAAYASGYGKKKAKNNGYLYRYWKFLF
jgi:hypothetical protein